MGFFFDVRSIITFPVLLWCALAQAQSQDHLNIHSDFLSVTVRADDGAYEVQMPADATAVLRAKVAVKINNTWIEASDYPKHQLSETTFENRLGSGHQVIVTSIGLRDRPDLSYTIRVYDALPFGDLQVEVHNGTSKTMSLQSIRMIEAMGQPLINLLSAETADRVLSDSFAENWQEGIYDLGKAPKAVHRAVGSQLIYNRESGRSLFVGALTSERFLTIMHLRVQPKAGGARIASYTVDCTGTTEVLQAPLSPEDRIELSLPLDPGSRLSSERLMFAAGRDYHAQLEAYGSAVRRLHNARVQGDNLLGWWSWLPYSGTINEGAVLTTAEWLSKHLKHLGYVFLQIDEGYDYARGEYATPDAAHFPSGMRQLMQDVTTLGLKPGIWAAPFFVSNRSWVYEHHKDWLVHNGAGNPIFLGYDGNVGGDMLFALDPTHPGAQEYLRQTYRTLVREWGMRYIKLDLMNKTTVEGYYYRPHTTALEAQRIGLEVIRKAVGEDVLLDKDDSPMLNAVGLVDEGRISGDNAHSYLKTKENAPGIAARYYMHRNFFVNDPDAFSVQEVVRPAAVTGTPQAPLSLNEAQVAIVLAAVSGGMFEIGDDLPTLGSEPDRLALVTNPDLLQMAMLGRASVPVDLLTYGPEDEQPSMFLLREDQRQSMLAVFNWTEQPRSRALKLTELGLPTDHRLRFYDVLASDQPLAFDGERIHLDHQPARSVRLIKVIDDSEPAAAPTVTGHVPAKAKIGEKASFSADAAENGVPALSYHWDFGDGTSADGKMQEHTYTVGRTYTVQLGVDGVDGVQAHMTFSVIVEGEAVQGPPRRYVDPTDQTALISQSRRARLERRPLEDQRRSRLFLPTALD